MLVGWPRNIPTQPSLAAVMAAVMVEVEVAVSVVLQSLFRPILPPGYHAQECSF
ncbi:MAG: hypothetical protein JNJ94_08630 [Chlorobi bacterium]|nr:hypothetical protein [Chlorobiota bacterium]